MTTQFKTAIQITVTFALIVIGLYACKPDDHNHDDEHDAITKVQLMFTDSATNTSVGTFTWADPDGIGGNNPTQIDTIKLNASNVYLVNIMVYALHDGVHEHNVTADILNEKNDHLFLYKNIIGNLAVNATDKDDNNLPVGVESKWITGSTSVGQVNVVLRHQPGTKNGTETPGDTDVDITFPLQIQ
ncbi:MAG: hypothetical protein JNK66_14235 [Chitinophagales bacterium]|nr:hypothetical protein [Chitinophagales bacterium]